VLPLAKSASVTEQRVDVENGRVTEDQVNLPVILVLEE
jgi:flavin-binding protein dodecin